MKEKEEIIKLPGDTVLFAYCSDCDLLLYTAARVDFITEDVAWMTANEHSLAFEEMHNCIVYTDEEGKNGRGYTTPNGGSC